MTNFLEFIEEDISSKKTLFSTMPTNTKPNIRKFNSKVTAIREKYEEYRVLIKKYLDAKNRSLTIKNDKNIEDLKKKVKDLEKTRFILNPLNTYFEKMGFDSLIFRISNYHVFNFNSLNEIINGLLNKFEEAGIALNKDDFDYTCYVHEYMSAFIDIRNEKSNSFGRISAIFERIYWVNPEIIEHIKLNFRKIIKKNAKKFNEHISRLQSSNGSLTYEDCLDQLTLAYNELNIADKENISEIIEKAVDGRIDINSFFEDSKIRSTAYSTMSIEPIDFDDKLSLENFYENLEKLKKNIEEYSNYLMFIPLIDGFRAQYLTKDAKAIDKNELNKKIKSLENQIDQTEGKLDRLNKKILGGNKNNSEKRDNQLKELKFESVKIGNELNDLYKELDLEYFKEKVYSVLNNTFTVSDLLELYYSFDYFKKLAIKEVFSITNYDEIIKYSDSFDQFAKNATNVIINGITIADPNDITRVIMNKYRLSNVNVNEEDLTADNLKTITDKIDLILRINVIEKSPTSIEKIWFMTEVAKFNEKKN